MTFFMNRGTVPAFMIRKKFFIINVCSIIIIDVCHVLNMFTLFKFICG